MKLFNTLVVVSIFSMVSCQTSPKKVESVDDAITVNGKSILMREIESKIPNVELNVYEDHLKTNAKFVGVSLIEFLDMYMGADWRKQDGILFTALDGYRSDISVQKILKYKPLLAFDFADRSVNFMIDNPNQNEKDVVLGPFYLVWDNLNNPELKREGDDYWPYQIAQIATISYPTYYAKVFPMKNPSAEIKKGFEQFKTHCIHCHSVSGEEGGAKGPVLYPNPAVVKSYKKFRQWTQNPSSIKAGVNMPALNTNLTQKERDEATKLIYKYLIALNKK